MRSPYEFQVLHSSIEALAINLEDFAKTFDHSVQEAYPIVVARKEGQLRAYAQLERRTIITPSISPKLNSPRETLELSGAFIALMRQIRPGFLMQWDQEFPNRLVQKMGMNRWPYTLYSPVD